MPAGNLPIDDNSVMETVQYNAASIISLRYAWAESGLHRCSWKVSTENFLGEANDSENKVYGV